MSTTTLAPEVAAEADEALRHPASICPICQPGPEARDRVDHDFDTWKADSEICERYRLTDRTLSKHNSELRRNEHRRANTHKSIAALIEKAEALDESNRVSATARAALHLVCRLASWVQQMDAIGAEIDLGLMTTDELEDFARDGRIPARLDGARRGY